MDQWVISVIVTPLTAAVSTLFWLYVKELRAGIAARDERIKGLEDDLRKHTETLFAVAETQDRMVGMLRTVLDGMEAKQ